MDQNRKMELVQRDSTFPKVWVPFEGGTAIFMESAILVGNTIVHNIEFESSFGHSFFR